jgi:protein-disulfide isomerase
MRRLLPFIIVISVGLLTVVSATMLYRAKRSPVLTISSDRSSTGKQGKEAIHIRGPADAPVTLEEFGDFQCPPCGALAGPIKQLEQDYGDRLRVIFHHFPLINHQHAKEAACAAEAAGLQGRFWEMHDLLYREQPVWSKAAEIQPLFNAYAGILGLNVESFKNDMQSESVKERVAADQKHGTSLGVQTTPTIFLNNRAVDPASLAPDKLRAAVDTAVKTIASAKSSSEKEPHK